MAKLYTLSYLFNSPDGLFGLLLQEETSGIPNIEIKVTDHITKAGAKCKKLSLVMLKDETKEQLFERLNKKLEIHHKSKNFQEGWNIKETNTQMSI